MSLKNSGLRKHNLFRKSATPRSLNGFSLIELLVALLVMAIGILGAARMEITGKRLSYDGLQRMQAVALSNDIVSRMRANNGVLPSYVVNGVGGETLGVSSECDSLAGACTPIQLAGKDLKAWEEGMDGAGEVLNSVNVGGLVSPKACITHNNRVVTISIVWRGTSPTTNPVASDCGENTAVYGPGNEQRRLLFISTFI
jgi:type IV pilus assembly protein PilV